MLTISGLKKFYFVPGINDMRCGAHRLLQIVKHKHHLQTDNCCQNPDILCHHSILYGGYR